MRQAFPKPLPRERKGPKPMKRSAMKRTTAIKQRRETRRRSERVENPAYLAAVRLRPCYMRRLGVCCSGVSEADHMGKRPYGRKADDDTAVPMCHACHRARTDYKGWFWGWGAEQMRLFCDVAIGLTRLDLGYQKAAA